MPNSFITNFTVGPAKLYHGVADFYAEQIHAGLGEISHRSAEFTEVSKNAISAFREFFGIPNDYRVYYTYSATEGMEILTRSGVTEKACHVSNGNFGHVWAKSAKKALKKVQLISHEGEKRVEPEEILPDAGTELLALTANETSTGICYFAEEIYAIGSKNPEALLCVDVTSAMGAVHWNFSKADAWFFSVQKAMGLPAGLGILIVGPRMWKKALEREAAGADVGCHHRLSDLEKKMDGKFQTPTTPNVMNIGGLGYVCRRFKADFGSIDNLYVKTDQKAKRIYEFLDRHPVLSAAVNSGRSESVIVSDGPEEYLADLHKRLATDGIHVGKGYGEAKTRQIRIGNFPVHGMEDVENLLEKIG